MESELLHNPLEMASSVLLALATVASAWCAYQAALWNGEQLERLGSASNAQFESTRNLEVVSRNLTIDATMFLDFLQARLHGDRAVADYIRKNVRAELTPALDAWISEADAGRADPPNPLVRPEYKTAAGEIATQRAAEAHSEMAAAHAAISTSSLFMLHTVMVSMALFFLGETGVVRHGSVKVLMLGLGATALAVSLASMRRLPRLKPPPRTKAE